MYSEIRVLHSSYLAKIASSQFLKEEDVLEKDQSNDQSIYNDVDQK